MIKNERQYRITRSRADQARTTISELAHTELPDGLDPAMRQLQIEALRSTLADLETELAEYQTLHTTTLIEYGPGERTSPPPVIPETAGKLTFWSPDSPSAGVAEAVKVAVLDPCAL